jgi:hypothetical protein
MTFLPFPAAGPTPGEPGHFAHHEWLEDGLTALDQGIGALLVLSQTVVQNIPDDAFTTIKLDAVIAQAGEWDYALDGSGAIVCGPAWVPGWYRCDYSGGFEGTSTASPRAIRLAVNGVSPTTMPGFVQAPSGNDQARPWAMGGTGLVHLLPADVVAVQGRHRHGSQLATNPASGQLAITFHYPAATP